MTRDEAVAALLGLQTPNQTHEAPIQLAGDVVQFPKAPIGIGAMTPEVRKAYEEIIKNATIKTLPMTPIKPMGSK